MSIRNSKIKVFEKRNQKLWIKVTELEKKLKSLEISKPCQMQSTE